MTTRGRVAPSARGYSCMCHSTLYPYHEALADAFALVAVVVSSSSRLSFPPITRPSRVERGRDLVLHPPEPILRVREPPTLRERARADVGARAFDGAAVAFQRGEKRVQPARRDLSRRVGASRERVLRDARRARENVAVALRRRGDPVAIVRDDDRGRGRGRGRRRRRRAALRAAATTTARGSGSTATATRGSGRPPSPSRRRLRRASPRGSRAATPRRRRVLRRTGTESARAAAAAAAAAVRVVVVVVVVVASASSPRVASSGAASRVAGSAGVRSSAISYASDIGGDGGDGGARASARASSREGGGRPRARRRGGRVRGRGRGRARAVVRARLDPRDGRVVLRARRRELEVADVHGSAALKGVVLSSPREALNRGLAWGRPAGHRRTILAASVLCVVRVRVRM